MEGNQFVSQPINWAFVIIATVKGGVLLTHSSKMERYTFCIYCKLAVAIHFISPQRTQVSGEEQEERENKGDADGAAQRAPSLTWPDKC